MTVNKRSKNSRQRASKTHGYGSMKKNRGAGNRGGRGNAGSGKRGDAKKPKTWDKKYFGKKGFKSKSRTEKINSININDIEDRLNTYLKQNLVSKEGEFYVLEMKKIGYNKLLSEGKVLNKYKIKTSYASKKAIEKIKSIGGEVTLLDAAVESKKDSAKE